SFYFNASTILGNNRSIYPTIFYKSNKKIEPHETEVVSNINLKETIVSKVPVDHGPLTLPLWFLFKSIGRTELRKRITKSISYSNFLRANINIDNVYFDNIPNYFALEFKYSPDEKLNLLYINQLNRELIDTLYERSK